MNGGYFRASKLRQALWASELKLASIQSSNHLNHWIDHHLIYKTLKDRHHWRLHALSRATGVLGLVAHAPPLAAEPPRSSKSSFQASTRTKTTTNGKIVSTYIVVRWKNLYRRNNAPPHAGESVGDNVHALQRRRIFRSPERGLPSSDSRNWHHVRTPRRTIYHLAVETPPSEAALASTCRWGSDHFSTRQHAEACARHTRPRSWHTPVPRVTSLCRRVNSYRHVSMPRGKKKKKRKKFGEAERGSSMVQIHPQGLYGLASKLSFLNLLFMQFP